jgi:hypothetical protein
MSINKVIANLLAAISVSFATHAPAEMPHKDLPMERHAENAVMQPVKDVNLRKDAIPEKLISIQNHPYDLENMRGCPALEREIVQLDTILGADINQLQEKSLTEKREAGVSRVAGAMIGGLIPFRGVVRELSGANASKRRFLEAIAAGNARRSFLKGVAVTKGCLTPPQPRTLALTYNFQGF